MKMINFCIPLGGRTSWIEPKIMLRSLEKNCLVPFECTFMVNAPLPWLEGEQIIVERGPSVDYENYRDTWAKYLTYAKTHSGEFMIMYDDLVLIQPTEDFSILNNVALDKLDKIAIEDAKGSKHGRTILRALELLPCNRLFNYESHLPKIINCELLVELCNKFNVMEGVPPSLATLYFGYYYEHPDLVLAMENTLRASFCLEDNDHTGSYFFHNEADIERYSRGKMFLHYNDVAINFHRNGSYPLRNHLEQLFDKPSKFEK
jgi:hypothetical protein